mmetsp:Transcript_14736/g.24435  ORF Transcript_14736/g.24435 Transcript_14736/m.24435 type:complete len:207 (-) Transcript_14736:2318-2938(-)
MTREPTCVTRLPSASTESICGLLCTRGTLTRRPALSPPPPLLLLPSLLPPPPPVSSSTKPPLRKRCCCRGKSMRATSARDAYTKCSLKDAFAGRMCTSCGWLRTHSTPPQKARNSTRATAMEYTSSVSIMSTTLMTKEVTKRTSPCCGRLSTGVLVLLLPPAGWKVPPGPAANPSSPPAPIIITRFVRTPENRFCMCMFGWNSCPS